jgi:hypothetical protein
VSGRDDEAGVPLLIKHVPEKPGAEKLSSGHCGVPFALLARLWPASRRVKRAGYFNWSVLGAFELKPEPFPGLILVLPLLREPERLREGGAKDFPPAGPGGPPWLLFAAPARDPPEGRWPPEVRAICVLLCTAALPAEGAGLRPAGRNGRPDACVTGAEAPADGKLLLANAALSRQIPPGWTALGKLSLPAVQLELPPELIAPLAGDAPCAVLL